MRLGLQQIKNFAKKIELPLRSKFRTFDSLFDAIEKVKTSQKPTFSRKDLQQLSAERLRTLSKNLEIEGWTKDRRKAVLIDKILSKSSVSNEILKQQFQWEHLKSELKKIQQKQKARKKLENQKNLEKHLNRINQEERINQENRIVLFFKVNFKTKSLEVQVKSFP